MAECHDPNGAGIDLWQPKNEQATIADLSRHGAPSWYETYIPTIGRFCAITSPQGVMSLAIRYLPGQ